MSGFIYLIESESGACKVGYSVNPQRRLTILQTASAEPLKLIGYTSGTLKEEAKLHRLLRPWRIKGEWFRQCAAIDYLRSVLPHKPQQRPAIEPTTDPAGSFIERMGGATQAAQALGISNPSVVLNWRARGQIPADKVMAVEVLSGISRHVLRPDIFGETGSAAS